MRLLNPGEFVRWDKFNELVKDITSRHLPLVGGTMTGSINFERGGETWAALVAKKAGDAANRFQVLCNGAMAWGDGTNAPDTTLFRASANTLQTDDLLYANGGFASIRPTGDHDMLYGFCNGDVDVRFAVTASGAMSFGPGTAGRDVLLYRSKANELKTPDDFACSTLWADNNINATNNLNAWRIHLLQPSGNNIVNEWGRAASNQWVYIDWHTGTVVTDYDVRQYASGGGASNGQGTMTFECSQLTATNNVYVGNNVSALSLTDRTPMPRSLLEAYQAVASLRTRTGEPGKVDHEALAPGIQSRIMRPARTYYDKKTDTTTVIEPEHEEVGRDLSATVSALMMVVEDLTKRIDQLETRKPV